VLRHLENLEVVLAPRPDKASALADVQAETGGLAEQLDGHRTLKDAAGHTRLDEFEAAKAACALLFLGLVGRGAAAPPLAGRAGADRGAGDATRGHRPGPPVRSGGTYSQDGADDRRAARRARPLGRSRARLSPERAQPSATGAHESVALPAEQGRPGGAGRAA